MGMVLINDVTKEDINAALIRLQKQGGVSQSGGTTTQQTIQNIQIQNSGGGSGSTGPLYTMLNELQKTVKEQGEKIAELESKNASLMAQSETFVDNLSDIQSILNSGIRGDITSVLFDDTTRIMTFGTPNGVFQTVIPGDIIKNVIENATGYTKICSFSYPYYDWNVGNSNRIKNLSFSFLLETTFSDYTEATISTGPASAPISGTHLVTIDAKVASSLSQYNPTPYSLSFTEKQIKAYTFNGSGTIANDDIVICERSLPVIVERSGVEYTRYGIAYDVYLKNTTYTLNYSLLPLNKGNWDFTTSKIATSSLPTPTWTYADFGKMQPTVNEVTVDNMQSVSSNAVAQQFAWEDITNQVTLTKNTSSGWYTAYNFTQTKVYKNRNFILLQTRLTMTSALTGARKSLGFKLTSNRFTLSEKSIFSGASFYGDYIIGIIPYPLNNDVYIYARTPPNLEIPIGDSFLVSCIIPVEN